jgi:hypothetical protein
MRRSILVILCGALLCTGCVVHAQEVDIPSKKKNQPKPAQSKIDPSDPKPDVKITQPKRIPPPPPSSPPATKSQASTTSQVTTTDADTHQPEVKPKQKSKETVPKDQQ